MTDGARTLNLHEIERSSYRAQFEDGLFDIVLGLVLFDIGLLSFMERISGGERPYHYAIYTLTIAVILTVLIVGKRTITSRRIGTVRFSVRRKRRQMLAALVLAGSSLIGLFMVYVGGRLFFKDPTLEGFLENWGITIIITIKIVLVFSLLAYILEVERLYLYGFLYMVPLTGSIFLVRITGMDELTPVLFILCSGTIVTMGTSLFIRFIERYPVRTGGD